MNVVSGMNLFKPAALVAVLAGALTQMPAQAAPAQVRSVTPQTLKAEIARNKGKVVVVNFWATWCSSCVKEMPGLAKLPAASKNTVVLMVSADDPANKTKVAQVAGQNGHRVTRLINNDIDIFFGGFDPKNKDTIALPRTYIYNRKGALAKVIDQDQTLAGYKNLVKPYI